jgi:hypothetical protein
VVRSSKSQQLFFKKVSHELIRHVNQVFERQRLGIRFQLAELEFQLLKKKSVSENWDEVGLIRDFARSQDFSSFCVAFLFTNQAGGCDHIFARFQWPNWFALCSIFSGETWAAEKASSLSKPKNFFSKLRFSALDHGCTYTCDLFNA